MLKPRYCNTSNKVIRLNPRTLYTDGSYLNGVAGWAVVEDGKCVYSNWRRGVSSNLAEGYAIVEAMRIIGDSTALIVSDSLAWVNAISKRRRIRGKGAKEILDEARELYHSGIDLQWIPSHTGLVPGNDLADAHACYARMKQEQL